MSTSGTILGCLALVALIVMVIALVRQAMETSRWRVKARTFESTNTCLRTCLEDANAEIIRLEDHLKRANDRAWLNTKP